MEFKGSIQHPLKRKEKIGKERDLAETNLISQEEGFFPLLAYYQKARKIAILSVNLVPIQAQF